MKKSICFILGIVVGIILTILGAVIYTHANDDDNNNNAGMAGLEMFEAAGDEMSSTTYEVFQAFPNGTALAFECSGPNNTHTGLTVLLIAPEGRQYYDDQKVIAPQDMIFRQVGLYRYNSQMGSNTVPAIYLCTK